jgi:hypothetical protein
LRAETAQKNALAFVTRSVTVHEDARYALQRFRDVQFRKLSDVFGNDGISNADGGALQFDSRLKTLAESRYDDFCKWLVRGDESLVQFQSVLIVAKDGHLHHPTRHRTKSTQLRCVQRQRSSFEWLG